MPKAGGQTTFSGTKFQAEITALYLGRLLDPRFRGRDEAVLEVRPEADAEAEVDDIVVRFADGHTEWMQVKENISSSGKPWEKMWEHFSNQLSQVENPHDRIVLILGYSEPWWKDLREICERAEADKNGQEWLKEGQLSESQRNLLKSLYRLRYGTQPEDSDLLRLYDLLRRVDVWLWDANRIRVDKAPDWMPASNREALDLFDKLLAIVWAAAEKGKPVDQQWLLDRLANEKVQIHTASPPPKITTDWTVPYRSLGEDFVGRQADLQALAELMDETGRVGIAGMGGLGKTQLAVEYAVTHKAEYPHGVFWLNAANPLLIELAALAETLGLAEHETPRDQAARAVAGYLDEHPQALLVYDNLEDPDTLNAPVTPGVIPAGLKGHLLFTTRRSEFPANLHPFEIKTLSEEAALRLLLKGRPEVLASTHPEHQAACKIVSALGGLPLALESAAAYFVKFKQTTAAGFLEILNSKGGLAGLDLSLKYTRLSEQDLATRHSVALTAALQAQWQALEDPDAHQLFLAAGQLPLASWIPTARLGLLAGISIQPEPGMEITLFDVALAELRSASLVEELSGEQLRLHPLVHEFAASLPPDKAALRWEMAANLAAALGDMATLERQVAQRGVDSLLEDLRSGLALLEGLPEIEAARQDLKLLECLLDQEAHHLRTWQPGSLPAYFLQQLAWRAHLLGVSALAEQAQAHLQSQGQPHIQSIWSTRHSDPALRRVLGGHTEGVCAVALSADGRRAVSASFDHSLRVWELETGACLQVLLGHANVVSDVKLLPDGRRAISASDDSTLCVWDLETGDCLQVLAGHTGMVSAVALDADGRQAISTSNDNTLRVWDLETGACLQVLSGHTAAVQGVVLDTDGRRAISASVDGTLRAWDLEAGTCLHVLDGHARSANAMALFPGGRRVISPLADGSLRLWNLDAGASLQELTGHSGDVNAVALHPDGRRAVSASSDCTLRVWDLETGACLCVLEGHASEVRAVALHPDGLRAISASADHTLRVWNLETGTCLQVLAGHTHWVNAVALGPGGRWALSASWDRTLRLWDLEAEASLPVQAGHTWVVSVIALFSDGRRALSAAWDKTLRIWELETGDCLRVLSGNTWLVNAVALHPDGRRVILALDDGLLRVLDLETGACLQELAGHTAGVRAVALHPDGRRAISASYDSTLRTWDLETGTCLQVLAGHTGVVNAVALSPGGRRAVSASDDATLRAWDLETGACLQVLTGHAREVNAVVLSPDGRRAISASYDKTLRVWDLDTGTCLHELVGHIAWVYAVVLSPDGRRAVAASWDSTLRVWDLETGACLHELAGHSDRVEAMALHPDGRWAFSVSDDSTLRAWDLETGHELACLSGERISALAVTPVGWILAGDASGNIFSARLWAPERRDG